MRHNYTTARRARFGKYRCRCTHCWSRRTLAKQPEFYSRRLRCAHCGHSSWWIDWYRTTKLEAKRTTCRCDALPFFHRRGSRYHVGSEYQTRCTQ
jgi:hypothetical protein